MDSYFLQFDNITEVEEDYSDPIKHLPAGEGALLLLSGDDVKIYPGFAEAMPLPTLIIPMTRCGDRRTYDVTVRGYTIRQLEALLRARLDGSYVKYSELIKEITPKD